MFQEKKILKELDVWCLGYNLLSFVLGCLVFYPHSSYSNGGLLPVLCSFGVLKLYSFYLLYKLLFSLRRCIYDKTNILPWCFQKRISFLNILPKKKKNFVTFHLWLNYKIRSYITSSKRRSKCFIVIKILQFPTTII